MSHVKENYFRNSSFVSCRSYATTLFGGGYYYQLNCNPFWEIPRTLWWRTKGSKNEQTCKESVGHFLWQKASFQPLLRLSRITCSILHAIRVVIMAEGEHGDSDHIHLGLEGSTSKDSRKGWMI